MQAGNRIPYPKMTDYQLKITGVHYGANGDSVAGQKDTEEMHMRTRELLSWIDIHKRDGSFCVLHDIKERLAIFSGQQ